MNTMTKHRRLLKLASRAGLVALLVLALPGEISFATHTLAIPWYYAWTVPVLVEGYFVVAVETERDRRFAIPLLIVTVCIAYGTHLAESIGLSLTPATRFALLGVFIAAAVGVAARLVALYRESTEEIDNDATGATETAERDPVGWIAPTQGVVPSEVPSHPDSADHEPLLPSDGGFPPDGSWQKPAEEVDGVTGADRAWTHLDALARSWDSMPSKYALTKGLMELSGWSESSAKRVVDAWVTERVGA